MDISKIDSVRIYPGVGISRVGNSETEYYLAPEIPGKHAVTQDGKFKDSEGKIKRQVQRFRLYAYDSAGTNLGELTADTEGVQLEWSVELANKKASFYEFRGRFADHKPLRNLSFDPELDPDKRTGLMNAPPKLSIKPGDAEKEFAQATIFNYYPAPKLGKLQVEAGTGRLLVFGGKGHSDTVEPGAPIMQYANNDKWYDDTSDGPVDCVVTLTGGTTINAKQAWVLVGPPKYAVTIKNIPPLYTVFKEVAENDFGWTHPHPAMAATQTNFYRDIYPSLKSAVDMSWVNNYAMLGHAENAGAHFTSENWKRILSNPGTHQKMRQSVFYRIRKPQTPEPTATSDYNAESYGQASKYFMPMLSGDNGDASPGDPSTFLTVTNKMYASYSAWANGDFVTGEEFERSGWPSDYNVTTFDEISLEYQPHALEMAALEWCVGGPFYPGIEMTYISREKDTYQEAFRINTSWKAGDVTRWMACPWQADFYECMIHWWPAARPDVAFTAQQMAIEEKAARTVILRHKVKKPMNEEEEGAGDNKLLTLMTALGSGTKDVDQVITNESATRAFSTLEFKTKEEAKAFVENAKKGITDAISTLGVTLDDANKACSEQTDVSLANVEPVGSLKAVNWTRGFRENVNDRAQPRWGDLDMVKHWSGLGYILPVSTKEVGAVPKLLEMERTVTLDILPPPTSTPTVANLKEYLKAAIRVEMSTIPPYLFAMFTLTNFNTTKIAETNKTTKLLDTQITASNAYDLIKTVAIEEMLHMSLAANILIAITDDTEWRTELQNMFYDPNIVPDYPADLPFMIPSLHVPLAAASREVVKDVFMEIEKADSYSGVGVTDYGFTTIGAFYKAVMQMVWDLRDEIPWPAHGSERALAQLRSGQGYYPPPHMILGKDAKVVKKKISFRNPVVVTDVASAIHAIKIIILQGEGAEHGQAESSHYDKFESIYKASFGDNTWTDTVLQADADLTLDYEGTMPDLAAALKFFNASFTYVLLVMNAMFTETDLAKKMALINGGLMSLMRNVLTPTAELIMTLPLPGGKVAGPTFKFYTFSTSNTPLNQLNSLFGDVKSAWKNPSDWDTIGSNVGRVVDVPLPPPTGA